MKVTKAGIKNVSGQIGSNLAADAITAGVTAGYVGHKTTERKGRTQNKGRASKKSRINSSSM